MEKEEKKQYVWWKDPTLWLSVVFIALIAIDQVIKIWADNYFRDHDDIVLIPGVIELCMEYNRGIAFSSFSGASMGWKLVIVIGTALLMGGLTFLFFKLDRRRALLRIAIVFIVAGGVGNLIDRILYRVWDPATITETPNGVRDMVRLDIIFDFGVCNFADFFIVAGAVMLVLSMLFFDADAVFPMTKKYKALAEEYAEKEERKKAEKAAKKTQENEAVIVAKPQTQETTQETTEETTQEKTDEENNG